MCYFLKNNSSEPLYSQIYSQIKMRILKGELQEGEHIDTIRHLAHKLNVSIITVRRAYDDLEKEGYIYSIVGRGSFIAEQNLEIVKEKKIEVIREQIQDVVVNSKEIGFTLESLKEMIEEEYKE